LVALGLARSGRFDFAQVPNEPFRFGWVVEIDPTDPASTPAQAHRDGPV
jgi:secreted PhoX family phosphatase